MKTLFILLLITLAFPIVCVNLDPLVLTQQALSKLDTASPQFLTERARLLYWSGKYTENDEAKIELWREGLKVANEAREKNPKSPAAIFWWLANQGEIAKRKGLNALPLIKKMEATAKELRELDKDYMYRGADRILGSLYQNAPNFISIKDMDRARTHFQDVNSVVGYPGNQLFYAQFLLADGKKSEAALVAQAALKSPDLSKFPIERTEWERMAAKILQESQ